MLCRRFCFFGCVWPLLWTLHNLLWLVHCPSNGAQGAWTAAHKGLCCPLWSCVRMGLGGAGQGCEAVHSHQPGAALLQPLPEPSLLSLPGWHRLVQSDVSMLFSCAFLWLLMILSISLIQLLAFWYSVSVNPLFIFSAHFFPLRSVDFFLLIFKSSLCLL